MRDIRVEGDVLEFFEGSMASVCFSFVKVDQNMAGTSCEGILRCASMLGQMFWEVKEIHQATLQTARQATFDILYNGCRDVAMAVP